MDSNRLLAEIRERVGRPTVLEVDNLRLMESYVEPAYDWLAGELGFVVREDATAIALTAGQIEYPLTPNLLSVLWVKWSTIRLTPSSLTSRDRDQDNWQALSSGTPSEYAIQGRKIALLPPPSAAAVTTSAYLTMRYLATPDPMGADGPQDLSRLDQWLVADKAALLWCENNISDENVARVQLYQRRVEEGLTTAKQRWANPTKHYNPEFVVDTSFRQATAR